MTGRRVELTLTKSGVGDKTEFHAAVVCAECFSILMSVAWGFRDSFFPAHLDDIGCDCETHGGSRPVIDPEVDYDLSVEAVWRRENNA